MILTIDLDLSLCPVPVLQQYDYAFALMVETPQLEEADTTHFFSLSPDQEYAFHIWIDGINALLNKPVSTVFTLYPFPAYFSRILESIMSVRVG